MLIKELKEIIRELPDDADIVIVKNIDGKCLVFPILSARITNAPDRQHKRLVIENLNKIKDLTKP